MTKKRILIVEDEGIVAKNMEKILSGLGYGIAGIAYAGPEAVQRAKEAKPDLVLMDIVLRGEMDGIEAAEQIRKISEIPIIYLTAYADGEILKRAGITEPYGYILKPFRERELHAAIEIAFYKHHTDRERERLISRLRQTLDRLRTLEGLLPICSHCKKIRDGQGRWHEISHYISNHSRAEFTHGICPDCLKKHYPLEPPGA